MHHKKTITPTHNTLWWLLATLWFTLAHLTITRKTWTDPLNQIPGPIGDNTVMLWNLGWVRHALNSGHLGYYFPQAYHNQNYFFLYGTHTWLDGLLYWLTSPLLPKDHTGTILFANINHLIATTATGLLIILALRAWNIRHWPTLLLISTTATFTWFRYFALTGHYHFFNTHYMLAALAALSWARHSAQHHQTTQTLKRTIAAGLLLGITFLNDQTHTIFAAILSLPIILSLPHTNTRNKLKTLTLYYTTSLITASIHLIPTIIAALKGHLNYQIDKTPRLVDLTSLILPPTPSYLGHKLQTLRQTHNLTHAEGTYLGIIPLILLTLITITTLRHLLQNKPKTPPTKIIITTTILTWTLIICALGDKIMIGPHQIITNPARLLKEIPILNNIRLPQRWIWPAHLTLALAAATLLNQLHRRHPQNKHLPAILLTLTIIPPLEAIDHPPTPPLNYKTDPHLRPPVFNTIIQNPTTGTILLMPAHKAYGHANILQFLTNYQNPMILTYTARMPIKPTDLPWTQNQWTPQTAPWLHQNNISTIIFPYNDQSIQEHQDWIHHAKKAKPDLQILDHQGTPHPQS